MMRRYGRRIVMLPLMVPCLALVDKQVSPQPCLLFPRPGQTLWWFMFIVFGAVDLQPRLTLFEFVQLLCLPGLPGYFVIL